MLDAAHEIIHRVSQHLGLSDKELETLLTADATHEFDISLTSGRVLQAFRVQHNNDLGPYKGGIRFHDEVNKDEVTALATLMSLKTAAVGLPLGGGKGGVRVNPKELSIEEIEEIARKYVAGLHKHIGPDKDIPAPDVNTNAEIIDWMVEEYSKHTGDETKASFTGKSVGNGGSHGREAATGRGGVIALQEYLELTGENDKPITIAIQGVGNVGSFFGVLGPQANSHWQLVAATDSSGGVYAKDGLSMSDINTYKQQNKRLKDYGTGKVITNQEIIALDVDVLVLAALGDVVTEDNVADVKARILLELANGPVNEQAHKYLTEQGVVIIPDVVANAGGVVVSYLEWQQNKNNQSWSEDKVNDKLSVYIKEAVKSAHKYSKQHKLPLKEAAIALAIKRILNK